MLLVCVGLLTMGASMPADQQPGPDNDDRIDPCADSSADWCLEDSENGGSGSPPPGGDEGSGGSGDVPACGWVTIPAQVIPAENASRPAIFTNARPPEGQEVIWQGWCYTEAFAANFRGPFRWLPADGADPVTAVDVAAGAYDRLRGRMPYPVVVTSPPVGTEAIVDVPVFVTVTNWQDTLVEQGPLLGDTVTVTATAELVLSPGEPGAEARVCVGPGRPYDVAAGDLWVQAAQPGACTYTYARRTGVEGRPDQWSSMVTVRWSIGWSATSGETGSFPVVDQVVSVPRAVGEVQAVLVDEER